MVKATQDLTKEDYIKILTFYKKTIPNSLSSIKKEAETLLREKLCKCIKKVDTKLEARSIGICTKSIFNSKGLTRGKFNCTGKNKSIEIERIAKKNKTRKNKKN